MGSIAILRLDRINYVTNIKCLCLRNKLFTNLEWGSNYNEAVDKRYKKLNSWALLATRNYVFCLEMAGDSSFTDILKFQINPVPLSDHILSVARKNCLMSCYWGQRELSLAGLQGNSNLLAPVFFYSLRKRYSVGWCSLSGTRSKCRLHTMELFALLTDKRVQCAPIYRV
jgi:hypothetical protein